MTIKSVSELRNRKMVIDLTGPQGNAFNLIGVANRLCKKFGKDAGDVIKRMTSGEYANLVDVFESEFGDFVTMYR